jgi:hypothetical protein
MVIPLRPHLQLRSFCAICEICVLRVSDSSGLECPQNDSGRQPLRLLGCFAGTGWGAGCSVASARRPGGRTSGACRLTFCLTGINRLEPDDRPSAAGCRLDGIRRSIGTRGTSGRRDVRPVLILIPGTRARLAPTILEMLRIQNLRERGMVAFAPDSRQAPRGEQRRGAPDAGVNVRIKTGEFRFETGFTDGSHDCHFGRRGG